MMLTKKRPATVVKWENLDYEYKKTIFIWNRPRSRLSETFY